MDAVSQGRVQILHAGDSVITQAVAVMSELQRLAKICLSWQWEKSAVIAREWKYLEPVRCYCELNGIPVQMADEEITYFWRLRETQNLLEWLSSRESKLIDTAKLESWFEDRTDNTWLKLLREAVEGYALETGGCGITPRAFHGMARGMGSRNSTPSDRTLAVNRPPGKGIRVQPCRRA